MNVTSILESSIENLFEIFFETLQNGSYNIITDEFLASAKVNVIEHVTTLLSTPNNQSIAEVINWVSSEVMEYHPSVAVAVEDCTLAAFTNLTNINNITSMDPLEYVPSVRNATECCLSEQGAVREIYEEFMNEEADPWHALLQLYWLSWGSTAVLFGPWCKILFPSDRLLFAAIG